jgi:hypothetical protein
MNKGQSTLTSGLAVVYLARFAEGTKPVTAFLASYARHEAGVGHDLIVIRKGFPSADTNQDRMIARYRPKTVTLSDDGTDISAYAEAAAQLPHAHVVFLNTFSEILCDNWLLHLRSALNDPAVGIAGATGSNESLHSSMKRLKKGLFLAQKHYLPSPARMRAAFQIFRRLLPRQLSKMLVAKIISHFAVSGSPAADADADAEFEAFWIRETMAEGTFDYLNAIPKFPNPHIRTNAFIIARKTFLEILPSSLKTKTDSYLFESGPDGLTRQILRRGKKVVVVGRNGQTFDVDDWVKSGTFRLADQYNLLVHDNQTRAFEALNSAGKRAFSRMTWDESDASSESKGAP